MQRLCVHLIEKDVTAPSGFLAFGDDFDSATCTQKTHRNSLRRTLPFITVLLIMWLFTENQWASHLRRRSARIHCIGDSFHYPSFLLNAFSVCMLQKSPRLATRFHHSGNGARKTVFYELVR